MNGPINKGVSSALPRVFSRRSAILKIVEEKALGTRLSDHFPATSFPGSLFSASLGRWKKDPGCGWSHDHPESGWQKNLLGGRGGRVLCLVDKTNFVGFKSSSSR